MSEWKGGNEPIIDELTGLEIRLQKAMLPVNNFLENLGVAASPSEKLSNMFKQMGDKKTTKTTDRMTKMFKAMGKNALGAVIVEKVMALLDPFLELMDLLTIPLEVIGAILEITLVPLFQVLAPIMAEVARWMLENKEIIALIITALAALFIAFNPVLGIFILVALAIAQLIKHWDKIVKVFKWVGEQIKKVWDVLVKNVWLHIVSIWTAIALIWNRVLKPVFNAIIGAFRWVAGIFWGTMNPVFKVFGKMLDDAVDAFKGFINGILFVVNGFIDLINKIPGVNLGKLTYLASGGIVTSPTLAVVGEAGPEEVKPLKRSDMTGDDAITEKLDELIYLQQETLKYQKRNARQLIRGRFG